MPFQCPKRRNILAPNIRNIPNYNSFKLDRKNRMLIFFSITVYCIVLYCHVLLNVDDVIQYYSS